MSELEALAASQVKIAGRDVLATWKILVALGVTPVLYSFYAILAAVVATKAGAPLKWRIWTPFIILMILPMVGYAALKFGEAGMDVLKYVCYLVRLNTSNEARLKGHCGHWLLPCSRVNSGRSESSSG